jgi:NADPH:quinone reductase-like Zn-dependent oxidoreductase
MPNAMTTCIHRFYEYGGPENLKPELIRLQEPGRGEVWGKAQTMSLNRADLLWLANTYTETPTLPSSLGDEITGVVEVVGAGVTAYRMGEWVNAIPAFPVSDDANFGETSILPQRGLMRTPDGSAVMQAASSAFAYFTGCFTLFEITQLKPYQIVSVTAVTSTD